MNRYDIVGWLSFVLAVGIVGGVENGAPLRNMIAAFILVGIMGVCVHLGNAARA